MKIGFVTTWLERGATYVTRTYMELLKDNNQLYVFARGGEYFDSELTFEGAVIEKGLRLRDVELNWKQFSKWIKKNQLDVIIFNEQEDLECVFKAKIEFPDVVLGSYIDYYKLNTVLDFRIFDFLLCNTKRHYEAFSWHSGAHYLPWGTNLELFKCDISRKEKNNVVFFHSAGMSNRKGTITLLDAFIESGIGKRGGKLIIHSQKPIVYDVSEQEMQANNISIIVKTVSHPGLYHLADVYVYPTTLDGLGLTIYEALAAGLPVIATDAAPMNEIISNTNGQLVAVEKICARSDGYYWPLSFVSKDSLIEKMNYYLENIDKLETYKREARKFAEASLDILMRKNDLYHIITSEKSKTTPDEAKVLLREYVSGKNKLVYHRIAESVLPDGLKSIIREKRESKRYDKSRK